jgi:hypothetical protein
MASSSGEVIVEKDWGVHAMDPFSDRIAADYGTFALPQSTLNFGAQVSGFRVQAINEGRRHSSRHSHAWTIGAGVNQAPATASFLNPEP